MELSPVFARRLYLALLVESLERPNVPKLIEKTGWPRRTIQDVQGVTGDRYRTHVYSRWATS